MRPMCVRCTCEKLVLSLFLANHGILGSDTRLNVMGYSEIRNNMAEHPSIQFILIGMGGTV